MSTLKWDEIGKRFIEAGVHHGVLYVQNQTTGAYETGVAWNGLTAVNEAPTGSEATNMYASNIKYATIFSKEECSFTIEAYTYPDEFDICDGVKEDAKGSKVAQQPRSRFGLVYVTAIGSDTTPDAGYKIHILYGCKAKPAAVDNGTINDSPEALMFSWECDTLKQSVNDSYTSKLEIDSRTLKPKHLKKIEDALFGTTDTDPRLPSAQEIIDMTSPVSSVSGTKADGTTFDIEFDSGDLMKAWIVANATTIKTITISGELPADCSRLFGASPTSTVVTDITFTDVDSSKVVTCSEMVSNCTKLQNIDFGTTTLHNNRSFRYSFSGCSALKTILLPNLKTSNVSSVNNMFNQCTSLAVLDLPPLDTSNVIDFTSMFRSCVKLTTIDVSSFDTSAATDFGSMFSSCTGLTALDLTSFDTTNAVVGYIVDGMTQTMSIPCRTQADATNLNGSSGKPAGITFTYTAP